MTIPPLSPEQLRRRVDPAGLPFETTAEVEKAEATIGQPRALRAVEFGLSIEAPGYNIFATGPSGTGRRTTLEALVGRRAADRPSPDDCLYLFDFSDEGRPVAVRLPSGEGRGFADRMHRFLEEARRRIPGAFESESYQERRRELVEEVEKRRDEEIVELQKFAAERDMALELTPAGFMTVPVVDGKPIPPAEFNRLPEAERQRYRDRLDEIQGRMPATMNRLRQIEREGTERLGKLDREVAEFAVGHLVDEIKGQYETIERLGDWLELVRDDVIEHLGRFRGEAAAEGELPEPLASGMRRTREDFFARYEPNVLVGHAGGDGAPVVFESNPTYYNLFGRVEYEATFGALSTDHRRVKAGALHRANGGYLMLNALDVLAQPFVWPKLKETLRTRRIEIEPLGAQLMVFPTAALEPEPIELDVKVVLIGSPMLYALLYELDEDVRKLFKVRADFTVDMPWDGEEAAGYVAFIASRVGEQGLLHLDREAVARVIEHGARLADHRERLSTRFIEIADLLAEASHWARDSGAERIGAADVEKALDERDYRSSLIEERIREEISEGTLLVDVSGERVGQVNGLSVARVGGYEFGRPSRITASTGLGGGDVVNIDRETELSGPIHDKGFLILAGFLEERYGAERPLSLHASLVFEQSYGAVEGDSASSAELFALLSSLAEAPTRQGIAVTGSVSQHGQVQAIGGVNEKIEGFFAVCKELGLDGEQGVVIPAANVRHLMLRGEVVEAVAGGEFNVWAIETVDEGIALLTGVEAGERGPEGPYPEGTIHRRIEDRLDRLAELGRKFSSGDGARDDDRSQ